jgi:hypothetical protein
MIVLFGMADRILDMLGLVFVVLAVVKITKGYPVKRWFF